MVGDSLCGKYISTSLNKESFGMTKNIVASSKISVFSEVEGLITVQLDVEPSCN